MTVLATPSHAASLTLSIQSETPAPSPYDVGLERNAANHASLTPLNFLPWAAGVAPDRTALIHGPRRFTWAETYARCRRLASALARRGLGRGDTVAVMLLNTPEMFECQFGVPMSGAVLNTLNVRLDPATLAFMIDHGEAKVLITDREFSRTIKEALRLTRSRPLVVDVDDPEYSGGGELIGALDYEALLAGGDPDYAWRPPADEWDAIALNYTSGTTGDPKGVVFHHRGAYLAALGNILAGNFPRFATFLWVAPMFHCNGWCLPWAVAALAGTGVCLRKVDAAVMLRLIRGHHVTHFGGAPIVHNTLLTAPDELWEGITHTVHAYIAGAAPPPATLEAMERRGVKLIHVYGLTETYGPATLSVRQEEWNALSPREQAERNSRQGVRFVTEEGLAVRDPDDYGAGALGRRHAGRGHVPRQHGHEGVSQEPEGHRGGVRRRLVPLGRPRGDAPGRLHQGEGPRQGHHHLGWREHLVARGRGRTPPPPGGVRGGRGGPARSPLGREPLCVRGAQTGSGGHRGRVDRALPRDAGALQGAEARRVRAATQDVDREDSEIRASPVGTLHGGDRMSAPALARHPAESPLVVGGCRLEYRWIPPARASVPTFVLLHEGLGSVGLWRDFPDRLARRTGAGVFVYSREGYGRSEFAARSWGTDYLHREALEVLPAVLANRGIDDPILLGHSDGASIALLYAGYGRWSPRALVLEAPHVFIEAVTLRGVIEARRQYEGGILRAKLRRWHADPDRVFYRWADVWRRPEARSWNIESLLHRIRCPALVIQGEDDNYGTLAQVEAIGRQSAVAVDTLVLARCGHTPHREAEAEVIEEVAAFVARL